MKRYLNIRDLIENIFFKLNFEIAFNAVPCTQVFD